MAAQLIVAACLLLIAPFVWAALRLKDILLGGTMPAGVRRVRCTLALLLPEPGAKADVRRQRARLSFSRLRHRARAGASGRTFRYGSMRGQR